MQIIYINKLIIVFLGSMAQKLQLGWNNKITCAHNIISALLSWCLIPRETAEHFWNMLIHFC